MAAGNGKSKRKQKVSPKVTALTVTKTKNPYNKQVRISIARKQFIKEFERQCGNVTATCSVLGISRETFYRWLRSNSRVNLKFRARLEQIKPEEKLVDAAEIAIMRGIASGDMAATIFTLKTKGKSRGWSERPENAQAADPEAIKSLVTAFEKVVAANPHMSQEERQLWIRDLSATGGVPEDLLVRRIRVLELTANV